jgi:hypothetical protein
MIVIARSFGQLGNRLFLYAHFIAAAREYGVQLANPCFAEYAHLFPATANDLWCRYPRQPITTSPPALRTRKVLAKSVYLAARSLSTIGLTDYPFHVLRIKGEQTCDLGSEEFAGLARSNRHLLALGWLFRSERLCTQHADAVRDHFQIAPEHRQHVDRVIAAIRAESDVIVGVHIRHGDYATFLNGKYFYSVAQYADWMRSIAAQLAGKRVAFLVCSNAEVNQDDFGDLRVHFGPGHIIQDMYAMAEADLLIGPPSTYTGWASFYGNVPLVAMETADQPIVISAIHSSPVSRVA